jgi:hypothetical protein
MGQLAVLAKEVERLNSKLDRLLADEQPKVCAVFAPVSKGRDVADLCAPVASPGSFAKASQSPLFASDTLFHTPFGKGYPEYDAGQARDADGQWTSGGASASVADGGASSLGAYKTKFLATVGITIAAAGGAYVLTRYGQPITLVSKLFARDLSKIAILQEPNAVLARASIDKALGMIPRSHFDVLVKSNIKYVAMRNMSTTRQYLPKLIELPNGRVINLDKLSMLDSLKVRMELVFARLMAGAAYVPDGKVVLVPDRGFFGSALASPGTVLHETAHALDGKQKVLSKALSASIKRDIEVASKSELLGEKASLLRFYLRTGYKKADYDSEIFAHMYAAKYLTTPVNEELAISNGFVLHPEDMRKIFGRTMREMDKMNLVVHKRAFRKGNPEFNPDQPRDAGGQWSSGGASAGSVTVTREDGSWQRAARLAGMAAFGLVAVGGAALAVRTGNASAALNLATHGRTMMSNAARIKGTRVSRSLLEASAYNLSSVSTRLGLTPYQYELARRFPGMNTSVRFGRDTGTGLEGIIVSVRSGTATVEAVSAGRVPANVFIGEALLADSASLGRVLFVGNLYAPATAAGALFSREYMNTVMRTAIANRVDSIRTFAGSSMGGFLWPQRGFELANPTSEVGQALRRTIATRAGQMLDGGAITRSQYDDIAGIVGKWGKDVPTRLAHMDSKVAVGGLKLKDFPPLEAVRGDITIGKALLAGTNGFYTLPKAKYEALVKITKSITKS